MSDNLVLDERKCNKLNNCIDEIAGIPQSICNSCESWKYVLNNEQIVNWKNNTSVGAETCNDLQKVINTIENDIIPNINNLIVTCNALIQRSRKINASK